MDLFTGTIHSQRVVIPVVQIEPPAASGSHNATLKSVEHLSMFSDIKLVAIPYQAGVQYRYRIIDGERLYKSCLEAGLQEVDARVIEASSAGQALVALASNLARKENPLREAEHLKVALDQGSTVETISQSTGIGITKLRQRLRLLELPSDLRGRIANGELAVGTAERIAAFNPKFRDQAIAAVRATDGKFRNQDLKLVRTARKQSLGEAIDDILSLPQLQPRQNPEAEYQVALANLLQAVRIVGIDCKEVTKDFEKLWSQPDADRPEAA